MSALSRIVAAVVVLAAATLALAADATFGPELEKAMERQDRLLDEGKVEQMVQEARDRARSAEPDDWYLLGRALGNQALAQRAAGDVKAFTRLLGEAREAFATAKELGGLLYAPAFLGLARCARMEDDLPAAERDLRQALRVAPGFRTAATELAQVLWERGLHADAELELHRLLEQHPDDTDARMLLGSLKVARKRWPEAEREFRAVVSREPDNVAARKLLGTALMFQDQLEEAARHWEVARGADPKDDEPYITLFHIYRRAGRQDAARAVLHDVIRERPGADAAHPARKTREALDADPDCDGAPSPEVTAESLVRAAETGSDQERVRALGQMAELEWRALPGIVYRLLSPSEATPEVRAAALRLIGSHDEPKTVPLLEILLFHPQERDPSSEVRRAAADALANMPTDAAVPLLYSLLDSSDVPLREAGVRGLAARTGKWFRTDLAVVTPPADWAQELQSYRAWWASPSGSVAKRRAAEAMIEVFGHIRRGRTRLAGYAVDLMEDPAERTWHAAYALFRALTQQSFGYESGSVSDADRARIAGEARTWLLTRPAEER